MNKNILIAACLIGMLAVVLGAYAAHGLEKLISKESVETFKTGVQYQMYYALFLLFLGISNFLPIRTKKVVFVLILIGLIFFSGSIYLLATNTLTAFDFKTIGFITPIGGLLLILSWVVLGISILRLKTTQKKA